MVDLRTLLALLAAADAVLALALWFGAGGRRSGMGHWAGSLAVRAAAVVLVLNLLIDLLYGVLDPRIHYW